MNLNIKEFLPEIEYEIVVSASRILDRLGLKGYLVGGIVRDMVLGCPNIDIDIVVEKDGIKFARELSEVLGGEINVYEEFLTSSILYLDKAVDIASLRKEVYAKCGSLPKVSEGTLEEDVRRRDFSINSLYMSINSKNFGQVIDMCEGIADLERGSVRVLHNQSFIDDPTRIFRGIRFIARFGYTFDRATKRLLKEAVINDVFSQISMERIRAEFQLILKEKNVGEAIRQMKKYNVPAFLWDNLKFDKKVYSVVQAVVNRAEREEEESLTFNRRFSIVSALYVKTQNIVLDFICQFYGLPNKLAEKVCALPIYKKRIRNILKVYKSGRTYTDYKLYKFFYDIPLEVLVVLESYFKNELFGIIIGKYVSIGKNAFIDIDGEDLLTMGIKPGPQYKEIFEFVLEKKLNGLAPARKEQMQAVEEFLRKK